MSKGIDTPIDAQVTLFTSYLWITASRLFYGRAMRNYRDGQMVPEVLSVGTLRYTEVLLNDAYDALCFFDVLTPRTPDKATVDIYFAVKLTKLYPAITERATEYVLDDVIYRLKQGGMFEVEEIFEGYEAWSQWGGVKREDNMQPFYLFRLRTNVQYTITC